MFSKRLKCVECLNVMKSKYLTVNHFSFINSLSEF